MRFGIVQKQRISVPVYIDICSISTILLVLAHWWLHQHHWTPVIAAVCSQLITVFLLTVTVARKK